MSSLLTGKEHGGARQRGLCHRWVAVPSEAASPAAFAPAASTRMHISPLPATCPVVLSASPPAMCRALWAIGCLAILTSICGFIGGCRVRCCLGVYVTLAVLATLAQTGLVLYLFIARCLATATHSAPVCCPSSMLPCQLPWSDSDHFFPTPLLPALRRPCRDNLHSIITIGRWVLLGLLSAQVLAIFVASLLRCCTRTRSYEEFQEDEQQAYDARQAVSANQLEQLKSKLGLVEAAAAAPAGGSGKRVISITAVSGSAAEVAARQQRAMRSTLFQRSDGAGELGKGESDLEAGKITSRWAAGWRRGGATNFPARVCSPQAVCSCCRGHCPDSLWACHAYR